MNLSTSKQISLINASLTTALFGVLYMVTLTGFFSFTYYPLIVLTPLVFLFVYVVSNLLFDQYIKDKLKVIYKSIGLLKPEIDLAKTKKLKNDELEIVNNVVLKWSEEKKKEIEELKELAVYRREFLGNISHELKTPIFNIQGYILTLLEGGIDDKNINERFLKKTEKSINRLIALVEDLEEITKLESGELKLKEEVFNLYDLTREVIDYMEMKAANNNTKILLHASLNKSMKVRADKKRIRQVLINLIDNAIKYGNPAEGRITILAYNFHNNYLIEVRDNGIGIPEDNIHRIFERFYRTEKSRSRDTGGTGLGLAIVKHIIEAHRQTISVRSKEGEGTTFSFTL
ncbi:cell wall metabolism sensor histidine kinase WalK, partial [Patescibacteria group bacterium]|nr:cell wall metabolism sensor histidine kinase WalK [Patescibacteria group bacterium]